MSLGASLLPVGSGVAGNFAKAQGIEMSTRCDHIQTVLDRVWDAPPEDFKRIFAEFHERVWHRHHSFDSLALHRNGWTMDVQVDRDGERHRVEYDLHRNVFRVDGDVVSDARVVAITCLPIGFFDGLSCAVRLSEHYTNAKAEALASLDKLRAKEKRILHREKAINTEACFSKAVKKARKEVGEQAAKAIAIYKRRCTSLEYGRDIEHPCVPAPMSRLPYRAAESPLPATGGIYFAWDESHVVYVGKSTCLQQRVTLSHHKLDSEDHVSWVEFPDTNSRDLGFIECHYIALCKPTRNGV